MTERRLFIAVAAVAVLAILTVAGLVVIFTRATPAVVGGLFAAGPRPPLAPPAEPLPDDAPTLEDLAAKVTAAYNALSAYADTGVAETTFYTRFGHTNRTEFSTRFRRDGPFRFEFSQVDRPAWRFVIWSQDGQTARVWWTLRPEVESNPLQQALGAAVGVSSRTSSFVPDALLGIRPALPVHPSVRLTGLDTIDGARCWRVEGTEPHHGEIVYWIDAEAYLIRRIYTGADLNDFQTTTTIRYTPAINPAFSADDFEFTPPTR